MQKGKKVEEGKKKERKMGGEISVYSLIES